MSTKPARPAPILTPMTPDPHINITSSVLNEAEHAFGFAIGQSILITDSWSWVYHSTKKGQPFILKIAHASRKTPQSVLAELEFIAFLKKRGIPASPPVPSTRGNLVESLESEQGGFLAWAYQKAPGALVDWREWSPQLFRAWGALLGRMHAATKDFAPSDPAYRRKPWHAAEDYDLDTNRHLLPDGVYEKGNHILEQLRTLPTDRHSYGLVHGDLHQWNFFHFDSVLYPFDFDNCEYDWFVGDFAAILHNVILAQEHHHQRGEHDHWTSGTRMTRAAFVDYFLDSFLTGYDTENRLDPFWLSQMPLLLRRRHLSVFVSQSQQPAFRALSDDEQAAQFPWISLKQHAATLLDDEWPTIGFERYL